MSRLVSTKLKQICPDSWVARAYGDYLADCAAAQAELLSAISNIMSDDSLTTLVDSRSDQLSTLLEDIKSYVYNDLMIAGLMPPEGLSPTDPAFINRAYYLIEEVSDPAFIALVSQVLHDFPQIPDNDDVEETFTYMYGQSVDDILYSDSEIVSEIADVVQTQLIQLDLSPNSMYTLNGSYVTYYQLLTNTALFGLLNPSTSTLPMSYVDVDGNSLDPSSADYPNYTITDLVDEIKTNFASATAWSQGFSSLDSTDVTEALAKFDAQIGSIIVDTQEKFAATVLQVKSLISTTGANVASFLSTASEWLGFDQIASDTFTTVDNTDIAAYTGASPLAGLNLKSAKGVAVATGKAIAAVSAAVWMGVKSLATKMWKKVKPYVKALTDDPIDIEIQNKDDKSYAAGNFLYSHSETGVAIGISTEVASYFVDTEVMQSVLNKMSDAWYGMETYFSEFCFRIRNPIVISISGGAGGRITCDIDIKYRPRCINVRNAVNYGLAYVWRDSSDPSDPHRTLNLTDNSSEMSDQTWDNYVKFIEAGDIYLDDVTKETEMYAGFLLASCITGAVGAKCWKEVRDSFANLYGWSVSNMTLTNGRYYTGSIHEETFDFYTPAAFGVNLGNTGSTNPYPTTVTNADFITATSGYGRLQSGTVFDQHFRWVDTIYYNHQGYYGGHRPINVLAILGPYLGMLIMQQYDRYYNPTQFLFLPYCKGTYDFSPGRYHIKTDAQNKNIAQILFNALVVVIVVVAAVLICKQVLKIFRTKKIAKMSNYMGQCDNAIWSQNKTLSYREQRKYLRYSSRVNKLTSCSSGLLGSESRNSIISKGVNAVKDSVIANTDVPKTIATGTWVEKQQETIDDTASTVDSIITLIKG